MASHNDDDPFDDDDLDALPQDALAELENNAIQFTQGMTGMTQFKPPPSSDYGDGFEDEDFVVIDESRSTPAAITAHHRFNPGPPTQREPFRPAHLGTISNPNLTNRHNGPTTFDQAYSGSPRIAVLEDRVAASLTGDQPAAEVDIEILQKQIRELLRERDTLKGDLHAKAGEIAIVRSKQEKTVKEYEREMAALRKLNEDKLAKQQKALEAARIAEKNATTERDFIKQDLAEETQRVRMLNRQREGEKKESSGSNTTPKKKQALSHRDGFDDDEIEILSPSKISPSKFQRRNTSSPRKPAKRKRKTVESPAGALEVIPVEEPLTVKLESKLHLLDEAIIARLEVQDDRFNFLGIMLDHRIDANHLRSLEELGKHVLPSAPEESFESIILGKLPELGFKKSSKDLPIDFCELLISLWSSCKKEEYLAPIHIFVDMLALALELKTSSIAPYIIDTLLPIVQSTAEIIAVARFSSLPTQNEKYVDVSACMTLLYLSAQGCMSHQEHITRFWKLMRWDFVLIMLSPKQAREDRDMMLSLLSTSVMKESFGAIHGDVTPEERTSYILDRLSYFLYDVPRFPSSTDKFEKNYLSKLRLQILQLLISMTRSAFASKAIAIHQNIIGAIVCLMSDELDVLYDYQDGHEDSARIMSLSTRLLYHLALKHEDILNIQRKASTIHGGSQKYLVCLSRLIFFDDDLVLEAGIDPDITQCAHELLNLTATPEEGEAVYAAFSSP